MDQEIQVGFEREGRKLYGVLHTTQAARGAPVVLFLHGWSGCRLGPHRMFVKTARRLCAAGFQCLRFDFVGRGDSEGDLEDATIASMAADARCAMDYLKETLGCTRFILLGICSGGKVAISCASDDDRVKQLVLWSAEPMGKLAEGARQARKTVSVVREYAAKLLDPGTWRKILAGQVNTSLVRKAVANAEQATPGERKAESVALGRFVSYRGTVLLIYGSNDPETCLASRGYEDLCRNAGIPHESHRIEGANHSFYSLVWERQVIELTSAWLKK